MSKIRWFLFFTCLVVLGLLIRSRIILLKTWTQQLIENQELKASELEMLLLNIDMGISALCTVLFVVSIFYLRRNYSRLKDKWRKYRGYEYEPFLVSELKKDAKSTSQTQE